MLVSRLRPTSSLEKALQLQEQTRQARHLLQLTDEFNFRGAVDLQPLADQALHQMTLEAPSMLAIRNTLILSRNASTQLPRQLEQAPDLTDIVITCPTVTA